jgi:hypothetical protein
MPEITGGQKYDDGYTQPEKNEGKTARKVFYQILPDGSLLRRSFSQEYIFTDGWESAGRITNFEEVIIGKKARIEKRDGAAILIYDADTGVNPSFNQ